FLGKPTTDSPGKFATRELIAAWVKTFRAGWLNVAMVPEWERDDVAAAVEARLAPQLRQADGSWIADYVRLRFTMRKPAG
ncbi:MAG: hypothetical protein QOJ27_2742, partial [Sphingomonadales bacterium]|nr:hypothetical protein [Sphingomonadales bacterium]